MGLATRGILPGPVADKQIGVPPFLGGLHLLFF